MADSDPHKGQFALEWADHRREPQCKPDPRFPNGIDIDLSQGATSRCRVVLPYPAKRCGLYVAECLICGTKAAVTTAGRRDDPRSITVACKAPLQ